MNNPQSQPPDNQPDNQPDNNTTNSNTPGQPLVALPLRPLVIRQFVMPIAPSDKRPLGCFIVVGELASLSPNFRYECDIAAGGMGKNSAAQILHFDPQPGGDTYLLWRVIDGKEDSAMTVLKADAVMQCINEAVAAGFDSLAVHIPSGQKVRFQTANSKT